MLVLVKLNFIGARHTGPDSCVPKSGCVTQTHATWNSYCFFGDSVINYHWRVYNSITSNTFHFTYMAKIISQFFNLQIKQTELKGNIKLHQCKIRAILNRDILLCSRLRYTITQSFFTVSTTKHNLLSLFYYVFWLVAGHLQVLHYHT